MKYLAFTLAVLVAVPAMALASASSPRVRRLVLGLLVLSPVLGAMSGINFMSMEHYRGPDRGFEITLADLIAVSLALALLIRAPRDIDWLPPNALLLSLYFGCTALSAAWSPAPLLSTFTLFKLLRCGLTYWVVFNLVRSRADLVAVLGGWTLAALLVTVSVVEQKYVLGVWRATGPFDHSNTLPVFLDLVLPCVLGWALVGTGSAPARFGALAAAIGIVFSTLASFSRSGIVICGASFGAIVGLALIRSPSRRTALAAVLALVVAAGGALKAAPRVIERFERADEASLEARREFNAAAIALVLDHPLGVGANAFPIAMSAPRYMQFVHVMLNEESPGVVHNIYLLIAAELGIVGLVLFLAMMARFLWIALYAAWRPLSLGSVVAAGAAIGMLATHAAGLLEWVLCISPVMYQFAFVCGVAAALAKRFGPDAGAKTAHACRVPR